MKGKIDFHSWYKGCSVSPVADYMDMEDVEDMEMYYPTELFNLQAQRIYEKNCDMLVEF